MRYFLVVLAGYLLGCSSMAFYLSKLKKVDVRKAGSGNLGASNTTALLGWRAGVLVALHDIAKGVLAVVLARALFGDLPYVGFAAGVACVMGHIFPFYLGFKGGKGFASYFGMTLALNWRLALMIFVLGVLITLLSDYISLATTATVLVVPGYYGVNQPGLLPVCILLVATAVMLYKHRDNYRRILKGEEIGMRSAFKGKHRVK